jgi:hypothetical protein
MRYVWRVSELGGFSIREKTWKDGLRQLDLGGALLPITTFNGDLRRFYRDSMGYSWDLPSGKTLCELEHGPVESSLIYPWNTVDLSIVKNVNVYQRMYDVSHENPIKTP